MRSLLRTPSAVIRANTGLSLYEFATLIGKAPSTVQALEANRLRLSEKTALAISRQTGVSLSWLLAGDPKAEPVDEEGNPWSNRHCERRSMGGVLLVKSSNRQARKRNLLIIHAMLEAILHKQWDESPTDGYPIVVSRIDRFINQLQQEFGLDKRIQKAFMRQINSEALAKTGKEKNNGN